MKLEASSYEWALKSVNRHGDSDLFPRPAELDAILADTPQTLAAFADIDISQSTPAPHRRFIVPKNDLGYRPATQLDVVDSIILTAILYQFGQKIEDRRRPISEHSVFSYRFAPSTDGDLFSRKASWNGFWSDCLQTARSYSHVLLVDISDFYNQIYHHTVENQLNESGFPNQATKWIMRLLEASTAKVSRGIPIGPHATHLLAEATLIPIDNSMAARGYTFRRYVDDIVLFFNTEADARAALYTIAEVLDKQQRLHLQNSKTQILEVAAFVRHCEEMIADRPINDLEENIIGLINKYAHGDPYRLVFVNQLSSGDLRAFKPETIEAIVGSYLGAAIPDFVRLRWFIRRLAQVGHPSAVETCVLNIERLTPALSDICHYLIAVSMQRQVVDWLQVGEKLLDVLINNSVIASNEYFQLSIVSLFSREPELNHIDRLIKWYSKAPPTLRREILLAASAGDAIDWVRERKEEVVSMDPWTRRAFVIAAKKLPREERQFFLRTIEPADLSEEWILDWAKKQ